VREPAISRGYLADAASSGGSLKSFSSKSGLAI
jgi:hypothetical protein